ncbi:class I SAM-dependent methyltransferase [Hymenobacter chitinivorans]|uniref:Methyltransferase family protein n=1 Tax=Hymenobacter chitinivorans DSM 11115 TaxID=1121954 RepID=A0A2M9B9Y8_9BACT|nr:class I SAM-dependent methyltransferase [Hymenobacter chitinivorans]PJJ54754.1 methyltransferase family protein [Hymenobacter chitinivorans DSM 11115]
MKQLLISLALLVLSTTVARAQQPTPAAPATEQQQQREKWNKVLTGKQAGYAFNEKPNALLAAAIKGRPPGKALDLGMGQGRNTIFLAQQGWDATGIDLADEAVALAEQHARQAHVRIHSLVQSVGDYDFGTNRWDLIACIYFGPRDYLQKIKDSLKPGGLFVLEGAEQGATKTQQIGSSVVFTADELRQMFAGYKILRCDVQEGISDFKLTKTPLIYFVAQKP